MLKAVDARSSLGEFLLLRKKRASNFLIIQFRSKFKAEAAVKDLQLKIWPSGTGKKLLVDFIDEDHMEDLVQAKE